MVMSEIEYNEIRGNYKTKWGELAHNAEIAWR